MLVSEYDTFVQKTDRTVGKSLAERKDIAIFGLAAEIGSVIAAIKKRLLAEDAETSWNVANDEIVKELGDVIWYSFALARIVNDKKPINIFLHDVANLRREIDGDGERAAKLRLVLDPEKRAKFLDAAKAFPRTTRDMRFEDYQKIAFLTARTSDRVLVEVCLAVLSQLSAELLREKLPEIELELNTAIASRPINDVLAAIAWHVAALASTYRLPLNQIAEENKKKVSRRYDISEPTLLHDTEFPLKEQFPRNFQVSFISIGQNLCRMYINGRRLGDDLTNNAYADDGYRFHDVMHFANVAKLGWSPVLRKLMKLKRKSNPQIDEIEDGARATIVEEAIIKAIHSEGVRLATLRTLASDSAEQQLFLNRSEISNHFLDFIHNFVKGLEVEKNQLWEWEEAIVQGYAVFHQLREEGQGTISVDLEKRAIEFKAEVCVELAGQIGGLGADTASIPANRENVLRRAILRSLDLDPTAIKPDDLNVTELENGLVSVNAMGPVQQAMWDKSIVSFKTAITVADTHMSCTAIAVADDQP